MSYTARTTDDEPIDPNYHIPVKCKMCEKCWFNPKFQRCLYGGPFDTFIVSKGHPDYNKVHEK